VRQKLLWVAALALTSACAAMRERPIATLPPEPDCRRTLGLDRSPGAPIRWLQADAAADRATLDAWCLAVGPALVAAADDVRPMTGAATFDTPIVITWNVNVGGGDIGALVRALESGALTGGRRVGHFVLLLQETFRSGPDVPNDLPDRARTASRHQPRPPAGARTDIVATAQALRLHLVYAPNMRNGRDAMVREDRGNAILATDPIDNVTIVELPFERQRRIAIAADVRFRDASGAARPMRVIDVHLDNRSGASRLWLDSAATRTRQARALAATIAAEGAPGDAATDTVLGGDLNTWRGFADPAYEVLAAVLPDSPRDDTRATFVAGRRLDHLLFRLASGRRAHSQRLDRFGSDHRPVMGWIE